MSGRSFHIRKPRVSPNRWNGAGSSASPTNEDVVPQRNRDPLESRTRFAGLRDAGKLRERSKLPALRHVGGPSQPTPVKRRPHSIKDNPDPFESQTQPYPS